LNSGNAGNVPEFGGDDQPDFGANLLLFAARPSVVSKIFAVAAGFGLC
jgi:hypothetical protein